MSDYLPEPILEKIFLSLPTKSLMKSTAVCKSWMSLIKSSTFIQAHLSRNNARLLLLNVFMNSSLSYSLLWDDPVVFGDFKFIDPITYKGGTIVYKGRSVSLQSLTVVGTYNGLVCLAPDVGVDSPILIWNPSIRKIVILPSSPPHSTSASRWKRYGFGYDSSTHDYKVLMIIRVWDGFKEKTEIRGDIYSLAIGSWKSLTTVATPVEFVPPPKRVARALVNVNGSLHWSGDGYDNGIMSFDMVSEVFCKIKVPEALGKQTMWCTKYRDCLAVVTQKISVDFNIWVMKEYGVAESWTKITLRHAGDLIMRELIYCRSEELMFGNRGPILWAVDCRTGQVREFITGGEYRLFDSFVESILLLGHADAISY